VGLGVALGADPALLVDVALAVPVGAAVPTPVAVAVLVAVTGGRGVIARSATFRAPSGRNWRLGDAAVVPVAQALIRAQRRMRVGRTATDDSLGRPVGFPREIARQAFEPR
jgi:hypothetical protein